MVRRGDGYAVHSDYNDVITSAMASRITGVLIVYSTVRSGADQRKHQSTAFSGFSRGEFTGHRWIPHAKGPVTRKLFLFDDVIMWVRYKMMAPYLWCRTITHFLTYTIGIAVSTREHKTKRKSFVELAKSWIHYPRLQIGGISHQ